MAETGEPRPSMTVAVGVVSAVVLLVLILATQVLFYNVQRVMDERNENAPRPQELVDLQTGQQAQINTYRWINEQDRIVAIPIDQAIELYVAEVKSGRAATRISTTTQAVQPATQGSGAPP